jgi:hypothetical protein
MKLHRPIAPQYRGDLLIGASCAIVFQITAGLALDGGELCRLVAATTFVYSCGVGMIVFQRPGNPTRLDLWLVRYGFLVLLLWVPPALLCGFRIRGLM